jgi:hypothetical protein
MLGKLTNNAWGGFDSTLGQHLGCFFAKVERCVKVPQSLQ